VKLPVMVTMDGFIISHAMEVMEILEDEKVREFIGKYVPENPLLDVDNPVTLGPVDLQDWNFEHKRAAGRSNAQRQACNSDVASEYAKLTGRKYGLFEEYKLDDADIAIVVLGSTAGTAKVARGPVEGKGSPCRNAQDQGVPTIPRGGDCRCPETCQGCGRDGQV